MLDAKILIVEDESIIAMSIQDILRKLGYQVTYIVLSGEEAIELSAEIRPDLVIMDISLEGELDGIQTAKVIKSKFSIPVGILTAHSDENTLDCIKAVKPIGHLLKPFNNEDLGCVVKKAMAVHRN